MARLRDTLPAIRSVGPLRFVSNIWREISSDNLFTLAAALAYAWLFAIFPFLIFLLTLSAYIPEQQKDSARHLIDDAVNRVMARAAADTIRTNIDHIFNEPQTGLLSLGLVLTLWAASGGMAMTMSALDSAFDAPKIRPFYKQRPLAILLTIIITSMILAVFVLLPVGAAVTRWLSAHQIVPRFVIWALNFTRYGLAMLLMFAVLAILYKFGTAVKQKFSFISPGALFTVLVWFLLGETFRFYVDKFGRYEKTYGTVGGVAIILLFFYLDALVLLVGAEINSEVDGTMAAIASRTLAAESHEPPLSLPGPTQQT